MTDDGGIAAESANESSQLSRDTLTTCPGPACESADESSLLLRDTLTTCPSPACVAFGTTRVWCNRAWSWGHEETARFVNAWHGAQPATEVVVAVPHDKCDPRGPSQDVTNDTASIGVGNHRRYRLTGGDVDGACVLYADELPLLDNTDDDRRDDSAHSSRDSADGNNGDGDRKRFDFLFEHLVGPDALVVFQALDARGTILRASKLAQERSLLRRICGKDTQIIGSSHLEWVHPHDRNMVRAAFAACLKDAPGTVRHVPRHRFQGAKPAAKSSGRFLGVRYDATLAPTEGGEEGALRTTANSCERGPSRRAMIIEDDIEWSQVELTILRNTDSTLVITREVSRVLEPDHPSSSDARRSRSRDTPPGVPEPTTPDNAPPPEASEMPVRPPKKLELDNVGDTDAAGAGEIAALRHVRAEGPESPTPPSKPAKHAKCPVTHRQPVHVPAPPGRREPQQRREGLAASLGLRSRGRTEAGVVVEPDPRRAGLLPRVAFASAAPDTPASAAPAAMRVPISTSTPAAAAVAETNVRGADLLVVEPSAVVRSLLSRFTLRGLSCAFTDDATGAVELVRSGTRFKVVLMGRVLQDNQKLDCADATRAILAIDSTVCVFGFAADPDAEVRTSFEHAGARAVFPKPLGASDVQMIRDAVLVVA